MPEPPGRSAHAERDGHRHVRCSARIAASLVNPPPRPHILGVDAAAFDKRQPGPVPIVGVVMEVPDRIESGLGIVDATGLADRLVLPTLVVTRHNPAGSDLADALRAAGLSHRLPLLERVPRAFGVGEGLYLAHAGVSRIEAERLVIGQAMVLREPRGRV
jgi:endonuclease V-like protein UPF0215 family